MSKILALLVRALRTESRDIKSHLFRFGLAVVIVMILMTGLSAIDYETAPGRVMFKSMIIANWVVVTLAAGTFFSIAISEETEQQTLGLLRMANVSPLALLLGKWLPRLLSAIVLILIQFPFTWLTVTLGGVNLQQIMASYLMLLAHLFLVGNLGLLCSVLRPNSASACALTFTLMVASKAVPAMIMACLYFLTYNDWIDRSVANEFYQNVYSTLSSWSASGRLFGEILSTSFKGSAWSPQVISNLIGGVCLFLTAWLIFDRVTMKHMSGSPARINIFTRLFSRKRRSSSRTWDWAIGWKDFRQIAGGKRTIIVKFSLYVGLYILIVSLNQMGRYRDLGKSLEESLMILAWIIFFILLPLELCFVAARLFRPELNDHTWSTLLTLPKTLPEIAYSKIGGAILGVVPSVVVLSVAVTPFIGELLRDLFREGEPIIGICYAVSIFVALLHSITLYSITVSWAAWPIAVILGAGTVWVVNMICWFIFAMLMIANRGGGGDGVMWAFVIVMTMGNLIVTGLLHRGIGLRLEAKGAES